MTTPPLAFADSVAAVGSRTVALLRGAWVSQARPVRWIPVLLLLVLLALLPYLDSVFKENTGVGVPLIGTPNTNFPGVLFLVGVFALCAIGLNVVVGLAGLLDLGYVGFFAVGAYGVAVFGSPNSDLATKYPWLICVPIAIVLTMVAGVVLGGPTLRLRGDYLAIVTLGFGEIVRLTAVNTDLLGRRAGISNIPKPPGTYPEGTTWEGIWDTLTLGVLGPYPEGRPIFGLLSATPYYLLVLGLIVLVLWLVSNLERSRVGRAWLAIREDEDAAELMGVPTFRFKLWAFAIGAAVGGISGALFAGRQGFINPDTFDVLTSILFLSAVVIGGAGNKFGVILGAVIVVYLPERLRGFDDSLFVAWFVVLGIALLITVIRRRATLLATTIRVVAMVAGAVLGLAVAIAVGSSLTELLSSVTNTTPVLVGGIGLTLIVGVTLIVVARRLATRYGERPWGEVTVFLGSLVTVLVGASAPYALSEIGDGVQAMRYLAFGLALIVMSIFRPQGLLPSRRRATELADRKKEVQAGVNA